MFIHVGSVHIPVQWYIEVVPSCRVSIHTCTVVHRTCSFMSVQYTYLYSGTKKLFLHVGSVHTFTVVMKVVPSCRVSTICKVLHRSCSFMSGQYIYLYISIHMSCSFISGKYIPVQWYIEHAPSCRISTYTCTVVKRSCSFMSGQYTYLYSGI